MDRKNEIGLLYLITDLDVGGAEKLLLELCRGIVHGPYRLCVGYLRGDAPLKKDFQKHGIDVFQIRSLWEALRFIKEKNIKLVHTHLIRADILGVIAGRLAGAKVISTKHNTNYFYKRSKIYPIIDSVINRIAHQIVCVSYAVKDWYVDKERLPERKTKVIYNGINVESFSNYIPDKNREELGIDKNAKIVTTVANFTRQKGYDNLLRSVKIITQEINNICFLWIGHGPLFDKFRKTISAEGMSQYIKMIGCVSDVRPFLAASDLFVLSSRWEGFGLVLLEAMAMRLPIVASSIDGIKEILSDEQYAILVKPEDPHALSQSIIKQLHDNSKEKCSYNNLQKYDIRFTVKQYLGEYNALLSAAK